MNPQNSTRANRGITLIEILIVITIVGILTTLAIPSYQWLRDRASFAGCVSRLRIMHVGLSLYMQDHDMLWPQMPTGPEHTFPSENAEWEWWYNQLKGYGVDRTHWHCPGDDDYAEAADKEKNIDEYRSSYIPTAFEGTPNVAFRWKQPWVIERGGFHYKNKGANMLMPDGTVVQGPPIPSF